MKINKKKVFIGVGCIALCGIVAGGVFIFLNGRNNVQAMDIPVQEAYTRTVVLEMGSINNSISTSGVVASANISEVTTESNYTVAEVKVAVGDSVNTGDVICILDNTSLIEQIASEEEKLAETVEKFYETYTDRLDAYNEAVQKVTDAQNTANSTLATLNSATTSYNSALSSISVYQSAYDTANAEVLRVLNENTAEEANLLSAYQTAQAHYESLVDLDDTDTDKIEAKAQAENAKITYDSAVTENTTMLNTATESLKDAETQLALAKNSSNIQELESAVSQAENAYNQAVSALEQSTESKDSSQEAKDSAYEDYEESQTSDTLDELYEQMDDYTLTAQTSGKITQVNATVGNKISGSAATIQDTSDLEIEIAIPEYDISKVYTGLSVVITSDISDEVYEGELIQIAPTASGGGSSSSTFEAVVSVSSENTDLLIGTNAMVEIMISSKDDVFTVPLDAIGEDENGNNVIFVQDATNTEIYNPVEINVGEKNDFYAEISSTNIEEGMIVRASADPEEALDQGVSLEELEEEMEGMMIPGMGGGMTTGGGTGGGMPSGGNTGGMPSGRGG